MIKNNKDNDESKEKDVERKKRKKKRLSLLLHRKKTRPAKDKAKDENDKYLHVPKKKLFHKRSKSKDEATPVSDNLIVLSKPSDNIEDYYVITEVVLGRGFFGEVKLGKNKRTRENIAVKVIQKDKVDVSAVDNEIQILSKAKHPNVVELKCFFDAKDCLYICMELMQGGELYEEIIKRKAFSEKDCSSVMKQILAAVEYLHSIHIIHRDIKLENILLVHKHSDALEVKLADFGLAKMVTSRAMTACGTPFYVG
eukprot:TRINITY_DN4646_c0_g1_i1.p1 TRINITY_DN4646_c0_g1~~TRINITY_DN4646_c0_g1_i1.p1  ORF type:complete len:254 (+),score=47.89 TRINITY_DN4646_c0_g1_i1:25-786(+)